jgi:hypothetical protein
VCGIRAKRIVNADSPALHSQRGLHFGSHPRSESSGAKGEVQKSWQGYRGVTSAAAGPSYIACSDVHHRLKLVSEASQILVLGTSLATYSAFRLVKQASEAQKPILMISTGPSRADELPNLAKMERPAGPVLRAYLDELIKKSEGVEVDVIRRCLDRGVVKEPPEVEGPRAEG